MSTCTSILAGSPKIPFKKTTFNVFRERPTDWPTGGGVAEPAGGSRLHLLQ